MKSLPETHPLSPAKHKHYRTLIQSSFVMSCYALRMQNSQNQKRAMLYIGLSLLAVPVLIVGSSLLEIDESGLGTILYFFTVGLPCLLIGAVLMIASFAIRNKDDHGTNQSAKQKNVSIVIKRILTAIIIIMLILPMLYMVNLVLTLFVG